MDARRFGQRVLLSRRDMGKKQEILAREANISAGYLSAIENGTASNPSVQIVEDLAQALGVSVGYLLGYSENPLPENSSPSQFAESHVVYEIEEPTDRRQVQALLDDYMALDPAMREIVRSITAILRTSATPRIIGDE